MSSEHSAVDAAKLPAPEPPPPAWFEALDDLYDRIDELGASHKRLAELTKRAYQHAQQSWGLAQTMRDQLDWITQSQDLLLTEIRKLKPTD